MPQLANRPLALLRCPDGRTGDLFFQKHPGKTMSKDLPRIPIREKDEVETYMYVRELPDVIHLVQMGVLEFHVWGSHVDDLEHPDIIVMDLDPEPEVAVVRRHPRCKNAARTARCARLGVVSAYRRQGPARRRADESPPIGTP